MSYHNQHNPHQNLNFQTQAVPQSPNNPHQPLLPLHLPPTRNSNCTTKPTHPPHRKSLPNMEPPPPSPTRQDPLLSLLFLIQAQIRILETPPTPSSLSHPFDEPHDLPRKCKNCRPNFLQKLRLYAGALTLLLPITSFLCGVYALYGYIAFRDTGLVHTPPNPLSGGVVGAIGGATIDLITSGVLVKAYIKHSRKHSHHCLPIIKSTSTLTLTSSHAKRPKPEFLRTIISLGFFVLRPAKSIPFDFPNIDYLGLAFNQFGLELECNLGSGLGMNVAAGAFGALSLSWILVGGVRVCYAVGRWCRRWARRRWGGHRTSLD
ncbi:hypothetical protein JAAARDRAFT_197684 [Jaapia argillacea MUCL 33604]|uniref:Uncharacterized protein n=1 Tax=Jaapia argillacea MUCL 33604 TaxID=933084 RepID=A0A067PH86_9AGAM|nr:hypothetical protein JAAARDRAFT_197684 [Jaapia argillacea MUCL 33604]